MTDVFDRYFLELRKMPLPEKTEHTDRAALESLLKEFAGAGIVVQHEPKRVPDKGAPDFKVTNSGAILGYVENKGIGENLDQVLKSSQIKKYRDLSDNILLTDYLHWIWITPDSIQRESLCFPTDLENPKFRVREDKAKAVAALINGFFSTAPEGIARAETLAIELAKRSQLLRDFLAEELVRQQREHTEGRLYGLYQIFRDQVFHELTLREFCDAFAQMLAYGLFLARLNADSAEITLHNAREYVPGSFRLIRELVDFLAVLDNEDYRDVRWVVEEVLSLVNGLNVAAIHEDLSFRHRKVRRGVRARSEEEARLFERDPFVYFYEDYLHRYDPKLRERRGVYYTPPPVVNFIVRAIDDILKDTFGLKDGLADHGRVTVLDFACGTGTFLVEVFERIFENVGGPDSGKAGLIVRGHMLKNIYGFEYLIAPYTVAHFKLSQYLEDRNHPLGEDERLQVFLTNTLEPIEPQKNLLLPELTQEIESAQDVKDKPILVITGNPPYSGHSRNMGPAARASVEAYKVVDGEPLGEKNPKWLQDDYVKFIRFAQIKMDAIEEGIVGIITNHSYLDNPTFRGMRKSLLDSFDQIWILDLHGSTKPKEPSPDGEVDENVFDIMKGVAITFFVKRKGATKGVWHADLWGTRLQKYQVTATQNVEHIGWQQIDLIEPFYLFKPQSRSVWKQYEPGYSLTEIFPENVLGFQTHRDHFAISFERAEMEKRIRALRNTSLTDSALRGIYKLKDNRDWSLERARSTLSKNENTFEKLIPCSYRPFDERYCHFGYETMDYPRRGLLNHVFKRDNLCLLVSRQIGGDTWRHVLTVEKPANDCVVSNVSSEANYVFPLFLYQTENLGDESGKTALFETDDPFQGRERIENFSSEFREWLDARYQNHFEPEQVMGYIYAVLYTPAYRATYADFLSIDFPRIPFPEGRGDFEALSELGWDLIQKHVLREVPELGLGRYQGQGDHAVEKQRYAPAEEAVYINKTQFFAPVPTEVWEFRIGGYQVIDKYLKYRKGRTLSLDEIENVENVANVLTYTIEAMQRIDEAYARAFAAEVA